MMKVIQPRVIPAMLAITAAILVGAMATTGDATPKASGAGLTLADRSGVLLQAQQPQPRQPVDQPEAALSGSITYQGRLKDGPNPVNGQYDFQFKLFDSISGGTQAGSTVNRFNQTVSEGLVAVSLDFGSSAFQGQARYLEVAVRPVGGGNFTVLTPRQSVSPAPYAVSLKSGTVITTSSTTLQLVSSSMAVDAERTSGTAIRGESAGTNSIGVHGLTNSGVGATGVFGFSGTGFGVRGESTNGVGVRGVSVDDYGVQGESTGDDGVRGSSVDGFGAHGTSTNDTGVRGSSTNGIGVDGRSQTDYGLRGYSDENYAVRGDGFGVGVFGTVHGWPFGSIPKGVYGSSQSGHGVHGESSLDIGVYGTGGNWAGYFAGNVNVTGSCCGAGAGISRIDHPLDPANKYLTHSYVESPEIKTVYDGNVTTDANGEAVVTLPDYFEALNRDFRYQLTIIGDEFAQARVANKIKDNRFTIKTDKPNVEVSWQVTSIRKDAYAEAHPIAVEEDKGEDRGKYLHPVEHGQPENMGIDYEERQSKEQP